MSYQPKPNHVHELIKDLLIVVKYPSLEILRANHAVYLATGYAHHQLPALTLLDLYPALDQTQLKILLDTGPHEHPMQLSRVDGSQLDTTVQLEYFKEHGQAFITCIANLIDDPRTSARQVQENQMLYHALGLGIFDLLFRIRRDGTYVDFKIPSNLGLYEPAEASEIIGRNVKDVVPPHVYDIVMPVIRRVIDTGQGEGVDYDIKETTGTHHYTARFVPSLPGEIVAVVRDVTEQRRTEMLVRQQRDLGMMLSRERNLDRALEQVLATTTEITQMDCGGIYVVDENTGSITLSFHQGLTEEFAEATYHYGPNDRQTQLVLAGAPIYTHYSELPIEIDEVRQNEGLRAFALVPIRDDEQIIACIIIASHNRDDIPPLTRHALETIAVQIGSSIARIRAEEAYRKKDRLLEAVAQANTLLLASPEFEATIPLILAAMGQASQTGFAYLFKTEISPITEQLVLHLQHVWLETDQPSSPLLNLLHAYHWQLPESFNWHEMLRVDDIINGPINTFPDAVKRDLDEFGVKSLVLAPVFVGNELWGVIGLEDHQTKREWVFEEIHVLYLMAISIGTAIERQRAEEAVRYEREKADTLVEVGMILTSTLDLDQVLARILEQAKRVVPYDTASIMMIEGDRVRLEIFSGYENIDVPPELIDDLTFDLEEAHFFKTMTKTHQPYLCPNVEGTPGWITRHETEWIKSWLGAPIIARNRVVGFFALDSVTPDFYQPHHIADIAPFARQAAIAFENATLFAEVQALERIKSRMIQMASHDLRSPLRHIRTAITEITENDAADPIYDNQYQRIWAATENMERLITNILSLERIEARYYTAQLINWHDIVTAAIGSVQAEIETQNHQLITEIAPNLPNTMGDPVQLRQSIVNLLDNAIKYTPPGGQITLRTYVKPYGVEQTIAIEVQDTGPGIPYDQQTNLFHPYFRAEQTTLEAIEGIGLGLSIVKAAIDYHKGRVYFHSIPGEGSMFGFWVPI